MNESNGESAPLTSVKVLLSGAIDYAGLFPPSGISMPEAVINYATYKNSNYNWMLGRFIVAAAQLGEFYESARDFISRDSGDVWRVSAVAGGNIFNVIDEIREFNEKYGPGVICDQLEVKATSSEFIEDSAEALPSNIAAYFELAIDEGFADMVATLALTEQRAKIRTGGVTADAFPKTSEIVKFVKTCLGAGVPFKATAGLHHPIRCFRPLTYENNSPEATMHGFLNLFLMTGFAREGYRSGFLEDVMEEEFEEVFKFNDQAVIWRDEFKLNVRGLERMRETAIQSFGSCSFDEPIADLRKLGIL
jgi:hypothetical protein